MKMRWCVNEMWPSCNGFRGNVREHLNCTVRCKGLIEKNITAHRMSFHDILWSVDEEKMKKKYPVRRIWTTDLRITANTTVLRSTNWAITGQTINCQFIISTYLFASSIDHIARKHAHMLSIQSLTEWPMQMVAKACTLSYNMWLAMSFCVCIIIICMPCITCVRQSYPLS